MKRPITLSTLSLLVVVTACAAAPGQDRLFGVVAQTRAHQPCVVLPAAVQAGQRITIAKLQPPEFVPATVTRQIAECGVGLAPGHAYELALPAGQSDWWASTAVVGDVPPGVVFKECTGAESVQLSAWRGAKRIWHGSYYVDYEMEVSCADEDFKD